MEKPALTITVQAATDSSSDKFTPILSVSGEESGDFHYIAVRGNRWFETKEEAIEYGHSKVKSTIRRKYGFGAHYIIASALHPEILEFEEPNFVDKAIAYITNRSPSRRIKDHK